MPQEKQRKKENILFETANNMNKVFFSSAPSMAMVLKLADRYQKEPKTWLVITKNEQEAENVLSGLRFFLPQEKILFFPNYDVVLYEKYSPSLEIIAKQTEVRKCLEDKTPHICVISIQALLHKLTPSLPTKYNLSLKVGSICSRNSFVSSLRALGYVATSQVQEIGEFNIKGDRIDLLPAHLPHPIRLIFFDDEVEKIVYYSLTEQRSFQELETVDLFPLRPILFTEETATLASINLRKLEKIGTAKNFTELEEQIQSKEAFAGIESYCPLFFEEAGKTLYEILPEDTSVMLLDSMEVKDKAEQYFDEILQELNYAVHEGRTLVPIEQLVETPKKILTTLHARQQLWESIEELQDEEDDKSVSLFSRNTSYLDRVEDLSESKMRVRERRLRKIISLRKEGVRIAVSVNNETRAQQIKEFFEYQELPVVFAEKTTLRFRTDFFNLPLALNQDNKVIIFIGALHHGLQVLNQDSFVSHLLLSQEDIFGTKQVYRKSRHEKIQKFSAQLGDLKVGDYVVHVDYGIGEYAGLEKVKVGKREPEFLVLIYAKGDKVYVPVDQFHLIQKYSGTGAIKNRLGENKWSKAKAKVRKEVEEIAQDILETAAKRKITKGFAFSSSSLYEEFELSFPYEETADQKQAIREVIEDMESPKVMDRLICGDVGFGKTEVAMRAAFKCAVNGKQVAILVPTTILAMQHYESFKKRMEPFGVNIGLLSRFETAKNIKETKVNLKLGKIDIVIGTHRLLSKDIAFSSLGLLVIDEEQRFGVQAKEKLKSLAIHTDCLMLSATPIPRTLHMSLNQIRDISVIQTPPMNRHPIRTKVLQRSDYIIQEAYAREKRRNGQLFFIHNRVEDIHEIGAYLQQILPDSKIMVIHGQMTETTLEKAMQSFVSGEYDVLLATTIIESGLDIPNANTIIVSNAQNFGLSQLYQIRGRVGRSHVQAYSYFLIKPENQLSDIAKKRVNVLREFNQLGAGFQIAYYDLEIRGSGYILGEKQSGHISSIGFDLYQQMVSDAINKLKNKTNETGDDNLNDNMLYSPEIKIQAHALLPDTFVGNVNERLNWYKKIASCQRLDTLWELQATLDDSYGTLPQEAQNLFIIAHIRMQAKSMRIEKIVQHKMSVDMYFLPTVTLETKKLVPFLQTSEAAPKIIAERGISLQVKTSEISEVLAAMKLFEQQVIKV